MFCRMDSEDADGMMPNWPMFVILCQSDRGPGSWEVPAYRSQ